MTPPYSGNGQPAAELIEIIKAEIIFLIQNSCSGVTLCMSYCVAIQAQKTWRHAEIRREEVNSEHDTRGWKGLDM